MKKRCLEWLLSIVLGSLALPCLADDTVAKENMAVNPPLVDANGANCAISLQFKAVAANDNHGYLVVTRPDGSKTEIRGGPSKGGGIGTGSSGDQPSGNPFECSTSHNWGVVVPYIGKHGLLGKDKDGHDVFSPDGNAGLPTKQIPITASAQKNVCQLANCLMKMVAASGKSCQLYTVGTGKLRNSNTLMSTALAACGVTDPLPKGFSATGWGESWYQKGASPAPPSTVRTQ